MNFRPLSPSGSNATPLSRLSVGLLAALGFLAATSALATDLYLTSIPDIAADLHTTPSQVQLTLSLFFFGVGGGQLLLGPLSDSVGRKPVLIGALIVFALAGVATIFTPSIEVLIALRLVQGISGAAGIVLSRAIAADLSTGDTAVRALSLIAMVVGLGPLLAPPIGGMVHELAGWRGVLATLAGVSIVMLLISWRVVPESLPVEQRQKHGITRAFKPFGTLLADPGFLLLMLAYALGFTAMISYISASPFVGQAVLGMTPFQFGLAFGAGASSLIVSNMINARVAPRVGPARMLTFGSIVLFAAGLAMLAFTLTGTLTIASFIGCAFVLTSGAAFVMSNASALALARAGKVRGSGSALIGAAQFALGGVAAPLVGLWGEHTALPMAVAVAGAAMFSLLFVVLGRALTRRNAAAAPQ